MSVRLIQPKAVIYSFMYIFIYTFNQMTIRLFAHENLGFCLLRKCCHQWCCQKHILINIWFGWYCTQKKATSSGIFFSIQNNINRPFWWMRALQFITNKWNGIWFYPSFLQWKKNKIFNLNNYHNFDIPIPKHTHQFLSFAKQYSRRMHRCNLPTIY